MNTTRVDGAKVGEPSVSRKDSRRTVGQESTWRHPWLWYVDLCATQRVSAPDPVRKGACNL
jgi:hypothetical protein